MPYERTATDRLTAYAEIETEQARQAREAAKALFKPTQQPAVVADQTSQPDDTAPIKPPLARVPRVLTVSQPEPEPKPDLVPEPKTALEPVSGQTSATKPAPQTSKQQATRIPRSEHGRIHALASYGMTITQVAEIYDVAKSDIERIVRQPALRSGG